MIKLQIVGNLGKDAIVKEVNGKNVINFSVAHAERFKDSQGNLKERTIWVECAYWLDNTKVAQYLVKGKTVYAEGTPEADAYINKDNQAAGTLRMRVQNLQLIGGAATHDNGSTQGYSNSNYQNRGDSSGAGYAGTPTIKTELPDNHMGSSMDDDDLPF